MKRKWVLFVGIAVVVALAAALWPERPVVELPAGDGAPIGVFITGDNGWKSIDSDIAHSFQKNGISIIGLVVPPFLEEQTTPEEAASRVARLLRRYGKKWHSRTWLLLGYSRGAGVVPFIINRLPKDLRDEMDAAVLIGLDPEIDFHWAPRYLFYRPDDNLTIPVEPEVRKLKVCVVCVRGESEEDSLCKKVKGGFVQELLVKGGHHFLTSHGVIARKILEALDGCVPGLRQQRGAAK